MEENYSFKPTDWNSKKAIAVWEINGFVAKYLMDLHLMNACRSFRRAVNKERYTFLSGFPSAKTWIKVCEYRRRCDPIKLSIAESSPEFPPDFPPLEYHTLNMIVFHYLLDLNLIEEARTFALHTSDDHLNRVDYTVVEAVREWIVPFTACISGYRPITKAGIRFLFPLPKVTEKYSSSDSHEHLPPFKKKWEGSEGGDN